MRPSYGDHGRNDEQITYAVVDPARRRSSCWRSSASRAAAASTEPAPTEPAAEEPAATYTLVEPGVLIAGSDTSFPPFESMNGDVAEGFDVDLIAAIAKEMGLESKFQPESFDTLIPTLAAGGKFDVIASGMTITDERKQEIDFSDPYIDSNQSIAMKAGTVLDSESELAKQEGRRAGRHHRSRRGPRRTSRTPRSSSSRPRPTPLPPSRPATSTLS